MGHGRLMVQKEGENSLPRLAAARFIGPGQALVETRGVQLFAVLEPRPQQEERLASEADLVFDLFPSPAPRPACSQGVPAGHAAHYPLESGAERAFGIISERAGDRADGFAARQAAAGEQHPPAREIFDRSVADQLPNRAAKPDRDIRLRWPAPPPSSAAPARDGSLRSPRRPACRRARTASRRRCARQGAGGAPGRKSCRRAAGRSGSFPAWIGQLLPHAVESPA